MAEIIMPKMGDAMDEGRIVQWLKNVGDTVKAGEAVAEIETDKSNVEIEAEEAGTIHKITFQAGEVAPVGAVIAIVGQGPAPAGGAPAAAPAAASAPTPPAPEATRSNGAAATATPAAAPAAPVAALTPEPAPVAVAAAAAATPFKPYDSFVGALPENLGGSASLVGEPLEVGTGAPAGDGRVKATPVARAMAQANGIDLGALRGSGPDGGIVKKDVEAALAAPAAAPAAPAAAAKAAPAAAPASAPAVPVNEGDEVQEYNGMRRTIARRLSESKSTIPHFYVTTEIDMEALIALREQVNSSAGENGVKVSINDCLIKAVAVALAENPKINAVFSDNKRILRKAINIGFGVAVADGLIVPVVKNCENKSLRGVARETKPLIEKARAGKLAPADYSGGSFTISNMGVFPDIEEFQAIVNPGEGAILAVASTRTVPAVVDGQIVPRKRMKVSLSADHRIVDGADGAQFLISLKRVIEKPLEMLA